ncbi:MAG: hypothetical protein QM775_04295 [Pirellulales bacterium]
MFFCSPSFSDDDMAALGCVCEANADLKLIGAGPPLGPHAILEVIRNGACDYLNLNDRQELQKCLASVMRRASAGKPASQKAGKLICVLGASGGSGASFLACNIAASIARRDKLCGLLDLHVRGGDLAQILNASPRYTISSLSGKSDHLDAAMLEQALFKHDCGIHLLAGPDPFSDYKQISRELVQRVLAIIRSRYDHVVVDLEDAEHAEQVRTLAACDRIVIPLRPDYVSLSRTKRYLELLAKAKVATDHVIIVANRTGQPREVPTACMEEILGIPVRHRIPNDPESANTAYNLGVPTVVSHPMSPITKSVERLVSEVLGEASPRHESAAHLPLVQRIRAWLQERVWSAASQNSMSQSVRVNS